MKTKKIITFVTILCIVCMLFAISISADYTYSGEYGGELYIPDVYQEKELYCSNLYPFAKFTVYGTKQVTFSNNLTDFSILQSDTAGVISYSNSSGVLGVDNYWEYRFCSWDAGVYDLKYTVEITDSDVWDEFILPSDLYIGMGLDDDALNTSCVISDSLIENGGINFCSSSSEAGNTYTMLVTHRVNYDNHTCSTIISNLNGQSLTYNITLDTAGRIYLRHTFIDGNNNAPYTEISVSNLSYCSVNSIDEYTVNYILGILPSFETEVNSAVEDKYSPVIQENENLKTELSDMTSKYQSAKEGLENTNGILNFFNGIQQTIQDTLNIFFDLELFGHKLGEVVAILLGAVVAVFIIKICV